MNQHHLRAPGDGEVTVGGGHRHRFVEAENHLWSRLAERLEFGDSFLHRKGIGARIEEEILDTIGVEQLDKSFGAFIDGDYLLHYFTSYSYFGEYHPHIRPLLSSGQTGSRLPAILSGS